MHYALNWLSVKVKLNHELKEDEYHEYLTAGMLQMILGIYTFEHEEPASQKIMVILGGNPKKSKFPLSCED